MANIEPVNLGNPQDLYAGAPQTKGLKPVTCELKAGSCTFHHGLTFHYAGPNRTDATREAFAIIYMPDGTTYSGTLMPDGSYTEAQHPVTQGQGFKVGQKLDTALFPVVSD